MNLSRALRIATTPLSMQGRGAGGEGGIAFVGAGGKTTAIFQLARELHAQTVNRKTSVVVVTGTSHFGVWQIPLADHHIAAESPEDIGGLPEGVTLITGPLVGDRTQPVNSSVLSWLRENSENRGVPLLIEADGSRQKPLKAPAAHEPPIPDFVDTVVVVAGLSGLGKPLTEEFVFRAKRFGQIGKSANEQISKIAGENVVTAEMLARVLRHPKGGLKNIPPGARRVCLLNQADTPELQAVAQHMRQSLLNAYDAVIVSSLKDQIVHAAHERVAGIVLAAGESKRFGRPKQLLDWRGEPFVRAVARTAMEAGLSPVIVVTGAYANEVENAVKDLGVKIVRNESWQSGQGLSIAAGVRALPENIGAGIFLLADQPQIGAAVIRALAETHAQDLPAILAPLVLEERRANPVLFDRVTFPDLLTLTDDVGGRAVFGKYQVEYLPWHDDLLLFDVDTPEDYERLKNL